MVKYLVYIDRIMKLYPDFVVNTLAIHRLLAAILVISAKFQDDTYYNNAYYANVCGLRLEALISLEIEFLKLKRCDSERRNS